LRLRIEGQASCLSLFISGSARVSMKIAVTRKSLAEKSGADLSDSSAYFLAVHSSDFN
jgi:hypothetical protein